MPDREWAPLPLERESKSLQEAIASLEKTISEVEQNNGYAVEYPEERGYVLDNLKLLTSKMKTAATISANYVKTHGLSVLRRVEDRFVNAAIGEVAKHAAKALLHWLHEALASFISF